MQAHHLPKAPQQDATARAILSELRSLNRKFTILLFVILLPILLPLLVFLLMKFALNG